MGDFQCCNLAKVILRLAKRNNLIEMNCICTFDPAFAFVYFRELYHMLRTGLLTVNFMHISSCAINSYVFFFFTLEIQRSFENERSHVSRYAPERCTFASKKKSAHSIFWNLPHYHQNNGKLVFFWQFIIFAAFCISFKYFLPIIMSHYFR